MALFVDPTEQQRQAAVDDLHDSDLVGRYWRLEDLTTLTSDERRRLVAYRYETLGFEDYCEALVAHRPRGVSEVANLTAVLDRWDSAFHNLRLWHLERDTADPERNPIAKVLIYEESRISGVRARLQVGVAATAPRPPAATIPSSPPRADAPTKGPDADDNRRDHAGIAAVTALSESVRQLAEAIDRLNDSIGRR